MNIPIFFYTKDFCVMTIFSFSSFDEENAQFCCEHIAGQVENTLEWEREMVIKRQQKVWYSYSS